MQTQKCTFLDGELKSTALTSHIIYGKRLLMKTKGQTSTHVSLGSEDGGQTRSQDVDTVHSDP